MTGGQAIVFLTLIVTLVLFIHGRWRYDVVSLFALLVLTIFGLVPAKEAFTGFGHPAVVTVAAVLMISRGLSNAGIVDQIVRLLSRIGDRPQLQLISLTMLVTVLSGFMNNVGALAILMPVAIQIARRTETPPSLYLMPLAFGSLLGGLTTMIGTPPNIIIAAFRGGQGKSAFQMFDFTPVGVIVALVGVILIITAGRFFIPRREGQSSREELFHIEAYTTEVHVPENCISVGGTVYDLTHRTEADIVVMGLVRGAMKISIPAPDEVLKAGDILVLEANSDDLKLLLDQTKLELVGSKTLCSDFLDYNPPRAEDAPEENAFCEEPLDSRDVHLFEAVVKLGSGMIGKTVVELDIRNRYGLNLLAVARQGTRLSDRLSSIHFQAGDVLLLQGAVSSLRDVLRSLDCFPLAERDFRLGEPRRAVLSLGIFIVAILAAAFKLLPIEISLVAAAFIMVITGVIRIRSVYDAVDWPIIIMLGAMIPVGHALETSGGAHLIAEQVAHLADQIPVWGTMLVLLSATIILSNVINNAATAVLMAPVAIDVAVSLGVSIDPLLMVVAIGSSTPFLTPIGHQSNTMVMGPGGYHFSDYWRLGLPLTILVLLTAIPAILWIWPL